MPGIFLAVKFQAHVFFWVRNMKLRRTPPLSYILKVPPPPPGAQSRGISSGFSQLGLRVSRLGVT